MLVIISSDVGRTDLFGALIRASDGFAWSPSAKAFVNNPSDAYLLLVELIPPSPTGQYEWLDRNVPDNNDDLIFWTFSKDATGYKKIGEPITCSPFLMPWGVMFSSFFSFPR